jgi:glucan 1,3-beta-glucosidase
MSGIDNDRQTTGSVTFIDSTFTDTGVAFHTAFNPSSQPPAGGSLILENISFTRVRTAVQGPGGTVLGTFVSTTVISSWGQGNTYNPAMAGRFQNTFNPLSRPSSLTTMDGKYYTRSKPQYETLQLSSFLSVRGQGATGDGRTDDTVKINQALIKAAAEKKVLFFDAGTYRVTRTIRIPPGSRIVGESYSVIMGAGPFFSDIRSPRPVVQVGDPNVIGIVEWSDMIVSTQGATAGAILIQWDLASDSKSPSGMWDVHTRIGGFAGSQLQFAECPARRESSEINPNCKAAFISMYISPLATGIYLENTWFWTADHDIEDPALRQITVYAGRGIHCASVKGIIWMVGTGVEHHDLYQYQFVNTKDIYAGQIQSETAYWQPNPVAGVAYPPVSAWKDPVFTQNCQGVGGNCASGWGLRIFNSRNIRIYGAGLYSFFDNYLTSKFFICFF